MGSHSRASGLRCLGPKVSSKSRFGASSGTSPPRCLGSKVSSKSGCWNPFWGQLSSMFGVESELKLEPLLGPALDGWVQSELKKWMLEPLLGPVVRDVWCPKWARKVDFGAPFWTSFPQGLGSKVSSQSRSWSPFLGPISPMLWDLK